MKKAVVIALTAASLIAALGAGLFAWRAKAAQTAEAEQFQLAEKALEQGDVDKALTLIRTHAPSSRDPVARKDWAALEIQAVEQLGASATPRLLVLYEHWPELFHEKESASLAVAQHLIQKAYTEPYAHLRERWRDRESEATRWTGLDADLLLLQGETNKALDLLTAGEWPRPAEGERLARIALIKLRSDPKEARDLIEAAQKIAPDNANIRSIRGRFLEAAGEIAAAQNEYIAALQTDPTNPLLCDQLGEFYRRYGKYKLALASWGQNVHSDFPSDLLWLKTYFWGQMTHPIPDAWLQRTPQNGDLVALVAFVSELVPDEFWNEEAFQEIPEARRFQQERQEIFWLRLFAALKAQDDARALQLLQFNSFRERSWNPEIESALLRILVYRKTSTLDFPFSVNYAFPKLPEKVRHEFFNELDTHTRGLYGNEPIPPETAEFLRSGAVFGAVVLAGGWPEAALRLQKGTRVDTTIPEWVVHDFAQALRQNRGTTAALHFVRLQRETPRLACLQGELLLASGEIEEGMQKLEPLAKAPDDIGWRAAWFLSLAQMAQNQFDEAAATVRNHPKGEQTIAGREVLARIAWLQGRQNDAVQQYEAIAAESVEAKAFLARHAFTQKNWGQARELTQALLQELPDQPQLQANLKAIADAERTP